MSTSLNVILHKFQIAKCPEEIFGDLNPAHPSRDLIAKFRYYALQVHPDKNRGRSVDAATESFHLLQKWKEKAEKAIAWGTYGKCRPEAKAKLTSNGFGCELGTLFSSGDLTDIYSDVDDKFLIKIVRSPSNNDLMLNEAKLLAEILSQKTVAVQHIPKFIKSLEIKEKTTTKRVNIFELTKGFVNLEYVMEKFPKGINPRHAAWIWNRMMGAILAVHDAGIVHGAIVPSNFVINPETHNGLLVDFCYGAKQGEKLKAIIGKYKSYYPPEVFKKESYFATDLYMSAMCIIKLLGGEPEKRRIPAHVAREFAGMLLYCAMESHTKRATDVIELHKEYMEMLERAYGKPKFIKFTL